MCGDGGSRWNKLMSWAKFFDLCASMTFLYLTYIYNLGTKTEAVVAKGPCTEKLTYPPASTIQIHTHSLTHTRTHSVYLSCSDERGLINSFNLELNVLTRSAAWPLPHINPVHQGTDQTHCVQTHRRHLSPGWAEG